MVPPTFWFISVLILQISSIFANECGTVEFIDPKIIGGTETTRGAWPFIVALYYTEDSKFFCGGTLISSKNVLTAAHCVHQKNSARKLLADEVLVLLGAYNLDVKLERGAQQRSVDKIYIHPDWRAFSDKFDADLAVFVLSELVEFTNLIRPICLPNGDVVVNDVEGYIVGWGLAENTTDNKHEAIPRQALTNSFNDTHCYTTNHLVALISSSRSFCGGGEIGTTPNKGDSGGGFFVFSGSAWVQYGIISAALSDSGGRVNANSISIYTNVKSFRDWITEIVETSGGATLTVNDGHKERIELGCAYNIILANYRCTVRDLDITEENRDVATFVGSHIPEHTTQDVSEVWFWTGTSAYIPKGLGKIFTNLKKLLVSDDDRNLGLRVLRRSNFQNMENLSYLNVRSNEIVTIDEDSLHDLPNLDTFIIKNNKLRVLHKNTFIRNTNLIIVDAVSNHLEFLQSDLFKKNLLLEEALFKDNKLVKISIDFTQLKRIKMIDFTGNICIDKALTDFHSVDDYQNVIRLHCNEVFAFQK